MIWLIGRVTHATALLIGVFGLAASAWAQDYTRTSGSGLLETRPASATLVNVNSVSSASASTPVDLPFSFPYYTTYNSVALVSAHGWVIPGATTGIGNAGSPSASHGQDSVSGTFPYSPTTNSANGIIAPLWTSWSLINTGAMNTGYVYTWTSGTAPTRHFVVSWENGRIGLGSNPSLTVQVHLYEGSGRIVFAYSTDTASYTSATYVSGLDSPVDSRFMRMLSAGYPGDQILDPVTVTLTGTLLYDQLVSDASGIGNTVISNRPIGGCRVELRSASDGFVYVAGTTAADGSFSITNTGLPGSTPGALAVVAQNAACSVSLSSATPPTDWIASTSVSFAATANVGTFTLGTSADSNGDIRSAFNVARVCLSVRDYASSRTSDTIPRLDTFLNPGVSAATGYQKAVAPAAASFTVASRGTTNPDPWDDAIVARTYARHILAHIAASPGSAPDYRFDAVTDTQNAFAEAFGYALWAAVSGSSQAIDGKDSTPGTVYDLESPAITVTKGPDVAGCVAGALFDLIDGANEPIDRTDGTSTSDRFFLITDAQTVAPTASTFLQAWVGAGYDAPGITRILIGNRVMADDAAEPNDDAAEATALGTVGVVRTNFQLSPFNEDWFTVALGSAAPALVADAKYDQFTTGAVVGLEIRDSTDALLASGTFQPPTGAVHAATGAIAAGTYRIRVRHVSGGRVPAYTVQALVPPSLDAVAVRDWTVGRPYDFAIGSRDGIAPYLATTGSTVLPPGLGLDQPTQRIIGTPSAVGDYLVTVQLRDGGDPANTTSRTRTVSIHDVLKIAVAPFVGFPVARSVSATLPTTGGTPPFTLTMPVGALPPGLSFAPGTFDVTGTAATAGTSDLELDAVDVAGSADHVATRAVVSVALTGANVPADLAVGDAACGWWFDAVAGSTVTFSAKTAKKQAKRVLAGTVLAPDRSAVTTASIKAKTGSLSVSKLVCPQSGRYFVVASSTGGDATQLLGNVAVAPPKGGSTKLADFAPADTTTIEFGALAGATLSMKFAGDKKQSLTAKVLSVTVPAGAPVNFTTFVTTSGVGGTLAMSLPTSGTWTVVLGATSTNGKAGKLSASYKLKQPKGGTYTAD